MAGIDYDRIAESAVDEIFGFRGRPVARAVGRAVGRTVARRQSIRAGYGTPAWRAAQAAAAYDAASYDQAYDPYAAAPSYDDGGYEEDPSLDDEAEGLLAEDEFGMDVEDEDEFDEEFGRRYRVPARSTRHPVRTAMRRAVRRTVARHRQRRQDRLQDQAPPPPYLDARSMDYLPPLLEEEEPYGPFDSYQVSPSQYGEYLPEPQQQGTFTENFKMGLGVGLGLMVAVVGANLVTRTLR